MARLPVRLDTDPTTGAQRIEIAPAIQHCLRASRSRRITSNALESIVAVSGVIILVLVNLIDLDKGTSSRNTSILYAIAALGALSSLAILFTFRFSFQRNARRYGSAARALERVRDEYNLEVVKQLPAQKVNELAFWGKQNVSKIESLLDDPRVFDIDIMFVPSPLPP